MSSPLNPRTAAAVALGDFADDHDNASWDDLGMVWVDAFLLAAYACDTCNGTGVVNVKALDGDYAVGKSCPEVHVVLPWTNYADPAKCEWVCNADNRDWPCTATTLTSARERPEPLPKHWPVLLAMHESCGWQVGPQVLITALTGAGATDALEGK